MCTVQCYNLRNLCKIYILLVNLGTIVRITVDNVLLSWTFVLQCCWELCRENKCIKVLEYLEVKDTELQSFMVYTAKRLKSCLSYAHTTVRDEKSCTYIIIRPISSILVTIVAYPVHPQPKAYIYLEKRLFILFCKSHIHVHWPKTYIFRHLNCEYMYFYNFTAKKCPPFWIWPSSGLFH